MNINMLYNLYILYVTHIFILLSKHLSYWMIRWGEPVTFYLELWLILGHMNDSKDSTVNCNLKISFSRWHTRFSILAGVLRDSGFCSLPLLSFLLTVPWKCSVSFLCSDSSLNNTVQVTGTWKPNSPVRPWSWGLS